MGSATGLSARGRPTAGLGSSPNQRSENSQIAEQNDAGLAAGGRGDFEVEEVQNSKALESASASDSVVSRLVTGRAATRAFSDIERDAEAGAVELVGKLGALERKPTNDVSAERQRESVSVPRGQAARSNR